MRIFIDSFSSSLGELPRSRRTTKDVLRALAHNPRVSTFERGEKWLEDVLSNLKTQGLIREIKEPYPWHKFRLTELGVKKLIE